MPTDFDSNTPRRKWIMPALIAVVFVVAIALANRQVDRTTAMAPDTSDKTVGLAPQGQR